MRNKAVSVWRWSLLIALSVGLFAAGTRLWAGPLWRSTIPRVEDAASQAARVDRYHDNMKRFGLEIQYSYDTFAHCPIDLHLK